MITLIPLILTIQFNLSPIQECIIQWQEYEILVKYMLDHEYVDVNFIFIDQFMIDEIAKIHTDYRYSETASVNLERGLVAFRFWLDVYDRNRRMNDE